MRVAVHRISKAYGFLWALRDITLKLEATDCVALLGPNGAGKTTLLKLFAALLSPTYGEITLEHERLHGGPSRLRPLIGFLSPHDHFYEGLTARENLSLFASLYGRDRKSPNIEKNLAGLGLEPWADEEVGSLSSGMKCRLAIAKWLLLEPKLMLLDEPYGVLDGSGIELLETYLKSLCSAGGIAVVATHHIQRAIRLCSRAVILDRGKLVFDEFKREPWESFHRAFEPFTPRD